MINSKKPVNFEEDRAKIAASLLQARKKAHLSQEKVSELIGKSRSTVSRHETGKFKDISLGEIYDYANCYNVPLSAILPGFTYHCELRGNDLSDIIEEVDDLLNKLKEVIHFTSNKK